MGATVNLFQNNNPSCWKCAKKVNILFCLVTLWYFFQYNCTVWQYNWFHTGCSSTHNLNHADKDLDVGQSLDWSTGWFYWINRSSMTQWLRSLTPVWRVPGSIQSQFSSLLAPLGLLHLTSGTARGSAMGVARGAAPAIILNLKKRQTRKKEEKWVKSRKMRKK